MSIKEQAGIHVQHIMRIMMPSAKLPVCNFAEINIQEEHVHKIILDNKIFLELWTSKFKYCQVLFNT